MISSLTTTVPEKKMPGAELRRLRYQPELPDGVYIDNLYERDGLPPWGIPGVVIAQAITVCHNTNSEEGQEFSCFNAAVGPHRAAGWIHSTIRTDPSLRGRLRAKNKRETRDENRRRREGIQVRDLKPAQLQLFDRGKIALLYRTYAKAAAMKMGPEGMIAVVRSIRAYLGDIYSSPYIPDLVDGMSEDEVMIRHWAYLQSVAVYCTARRNEAH